MSLFHASTCFEHHVLIVRRPKLYYTASGIVTLCRWPSRAQSVHRTPTYRFDDTRGCIVQVWPPDDEHMCSKHVEAWNKLIIKFIASSWLILRWIYWDARSAKYQNLCSKSMAEVQEVRQKIFISFPSEDTEQWTCTVGSSLFILMSIWNP